MLVYTYSLQPTEQRTLSQRLTWDELHSKLRRLAFFKGIPAAGGFAADSPTDEEPTLGADCGILNLQPLIPYTSTPTSLNPDLGKSFKGGSHGVPVCRDFDLRFQPRLFVW